MSCVHSFQTISLHGAKLTSVSHRELQTTRVDNIFKKYSHFFSEGLTHMSDVTIYLARVTFVLA